MSRKDWLKRTMETREQMQDEQTAPDTQSAPEPILAQETGIAEKGRKGRSKKVEKQGKSSDPAYRQVNIYLLKRAHDAATIRLVKEGRKRDFSELVGDLVEAWLKKA